MKVDLTIQNGKVYVGGELFDGGIAIQDGKTVAICENRYLPDSEDVLDVQGKLVLPGVIDTHVHVRDPGHRERGTFFTETRAAAAGGVTCFLEHPISSPPPYSPEILRNRIAVAAPQGLVDYAFFGAAGAEFPRRFPRLPRRVSWHTNLSP